MKTPLQNFVSGFSWAAGCWALRFWVEGFLFKASIRSLRVPFKGSIRVPLNGSIGFGLGFGFSGFGFRVRVWDRARVKVAISEGIVLGST